MVATLVTDRILKGSDEFFLKQLVAGKLAACFSERERARARARESYRKNGGWTRRAARAC